MLFNGEGLGNFRKETGCGVLMNILDNIIQQVLSAGDDQCG